MAEFRVLRVLLEDVEPAIERRVRVDADATLFDLYLVLVNAMRWGDSHLHLFEAGEDVYSAPVPGIEPMGIDERTVTVGEVLAQPGSSITWVYDLGDNWRHEIVVEEVGSAEGPVPATILDGVGACPPDDCGGAWGYMEILALLDDPSYRSEVVDQEFLESWLVDGFDPTAFDRDAAQRAVDDPPSRPTWDEIYAAYPDVGDHWTREAMADRRLALEEWMSSMDTDPDLDPET